jgi:hypothetical protein
VIREQPGDRFVHAQGNAYWCCIINIIFDS